MMCFLFIAAANSCLSSTPPIRPSCVKNRFVNASLARASCVKPPKPAGFTQLPGTRSAYTGCVKPANSVGFTQLPRPFGVKNNCVNPTNPVGFTQSSELA